MEEAGPGTGEWSDGRCPPCLPQALVLKPPELLRNRSWREQKKDPSRSEFMPASLSWECRCVSESPNQDFLLGKGKKDRKNTRRRDCGSRSSDEGALWDRQASGRQAVQVPTLRGAEGPWPSHNLTGGLSQGLWAHS